jgi:hypothetical protein
MTDEITKKLDEIKDTLESFEETINNRLTELIHAVKEKK